MRRRFAEQIIESIAPVQILDAPLPPVVLDGVQDRILQRFRVPLLVDNSEQEIYSPDRLPPSAVLAAMQMVKQLAEVPVVSPTDCALSVPVPRIGNELVELPLSQSSSSPLLSRPSTFQFLVVPDRVHQCFVEQIFTEDFEGSSARHGSAWWVFLLLRDRYPRATVETSAIPQVQFLDTVLALTAASWRCVVFF